jgi:hypothetical protein
MEYNVGFKIVEFCEYCEKQTDNYNITYGAKHYICDECYENLYCECGTQLEDSYGSPGDGFCIRCR